jgi:hypothetical protein
MSDMNLPHVFELLNSAPEQRIELRGSNAERQVRLMAGAGLVEATLDDGQDGSFTSVNRITATGHAFLRVFKKFPMPSTVSAVASV